MEIATLTCLPEQEGSASGELDQSSGIRKGPKGDDIYCVQFPRNPGATVAENLRSVITIRDCGIPQPFHEGGESAGHRDHRERVRVGDLPGHCIGSLDQLRCATSAARSVSRHMHCLECQGTGDPIRFARAK